MTYCCAWRKHKYVYHYDFYKAQNKTQEVYVAFAFYYYITYCVGLYYFKFIIQGGVKFSTGGKARESYD